MRERLSRAERLSRELDEAIEQQHFARVRFTETCHARAAAERAYEIELMNERVDG